MMRCEIHVQAITHSVAQPGENVVCFIKQMRGAAGPTRTPVFVKGAARNPLQYTTSAPSEDLEVCLRSAVGAGNAITPSHGEYAAASRCKNGRYDIIGMKPLAIAVPTSAAEVQAVVRCVASAKVDACARAGAHGEHRAQPCSRRAYGRRIPGVAWGRTLR